MDATYPQQFQSAAQIPGFPKSSRITVCGCAPTFQSAAQIPGFPKPYKLLIGIYYLFKFQSAAQIPRFPKQADNFRRIRHRSGFNLPRRFLASLSAISGSLGRLDESFQSAAQIPHFPKIAGNGAVGYGWSQVSICRADSSLP